MNITEFLAMDSIDQITYYQKSSKIYDNNHYLYYVHNSVVTMMYDIDLDIRLKPTVRNIWKLQRAEIVHSGIKKVYVSDFPNDGVADSKFNLN